MLLRLPFSALFTRTWWLLLACLVLGTASRALAQAPAWQSALPMPASVSASAYDAAGNVYLAGRFTGTRQFGSTALSTTAVIGDLYIAKYNLTSNRFLWAVQAGGTQSNQAVVTKLVVAGSSVYAGGTFLSHTATFGSTTLPNASIAARVDDGFTIYVTKLTDAGTSARFVWAKAGGSTYLGSLAGLVVLGSNVYLTGYFNGNTAKFDNITLVSGVGVTNPARPADNYGFSDVYLARLTDAGPTASFTWAIRAGGGGDDAGQALTTDGNSLYLAGFFSGKPLGTGFGTATITGVGGRDVFVAKYTDTGTTATCLWAQQAGGTDNDEVSRLAVSGVSVYVAGSFGSVSASFGATTLALLTSPIYSDRDVYIAKLSDAGTSAGFVWAERLGGTLDESVQALLPQGSALYLAGLFSSPTLSLGSTTLTNGTTGGNLSSAYITKLVDTGSARQFVWAKALSNASGVAFNTLYVTGQRLYASANIRATTSFDSLLLTDPVVGTEFGVLTTLTDNLALATEPAVAALASDLYPNPAHEHTTVRLPAIAGVKQATLTLRNALGQVVQTTCLTLPATGLSQEVKLGGLPSGVYMLQVQAGNTTAVHRLVVE